MVCLVLLLQIETVQQFVANQASRYVSDKTGTRVEIGRLYIDFPASVTIENLFADDLSKDTLVSLRRLHADVDMWAVLDGEIGVKHLQIEALTAKIRRTESDSTFNFDFLIQAFAGTEPAPEKQPADTAAGSLRFTLGTIDLQNIRFLYDDAFEGLYSQGTIGHFGLEMRKTDLARMHFSAKKLFLNQSQAVFEIRKSKASPPETQSPGPLPDLHLDQLSVAGVNFGFHHIPDSSFFDFGIGNLDITPRRIDLNRQKIEFQTIKLHHSDIRIARQNKPEVPGSPVVASPANASPHANNWQVHLAHLDFDQNALHYHVTNLRPIPFGIDYNHLEASDIQIAGDQLVYSPDIIKGNLTRLSLKEKSGLDLRQFQTHFIYDSTHAALTDLLIETPKTRIAEQLVASYPSIDALSTQIEKLGINARFAHSRIAMADVLLFAPDLAKQPIFRKNKDLVLEMDGNLEGTVGNLLARSLALRAGGTSLSLDGKMVGLPQPKKLRFDLKLNYLTTGRQALSALLPVSMLPGSVRIPDRLSVSGSASGNLNHMQARLTLHSSDGAATAKANYRAGTTQPVYTVEVAANGLHMGRILKQTPVLGKVTARFHVDGKSFDPKAISATATGTVDQIQIKGYNYQGIDIEAHADGGVYHVDTRIADPHLDLTLSAEASVDKKNEYASAELTLVRADLKDLKLHDSDLQISTRLQANVQNFDPQYLDGRLKISGFTVLKEGQRITMDSLVVVADNEPGQHSLTMAGDMVDLDYRGNISVDQVAPALQNYLARQLGDRLAKKDTGDARFTANLRIKPHPVFGEALLPDLKNFSGFSLDVEFAARDSVLQANGQSNLVKYGNNALHNFQLMVAADENTLQYEVSADSIRSGNMAIPKTGLKGNVADKIIDFNLSVIHPDTGDRLRIQGTVNHQKAAETLISLTGGSITLNQQKWLLEPDNQILIRPGGINVRHFGLEQNGQFIRAQSVNESPAAPLDIRFQAFEIGTLSRIVEQDTAIVRGLIDGEVHIKKMDPFAFTSDLTIRNIMYQNVGIGNLSLKADNLTQNRYTAKMGLSGDSNDVKLEGYYQNDVVDFGLVINQLKMKMLEAFVPDLVRNAEGALHGSMKISGKLAAPAIVGTLGFRNAGFLLVPTNSRLTLRNEKINIDGKGLHFHDFTVLDGEGQPLQVNGEILTQSFSDLDFHLDITTRNFTVLKTTEKDNAAYYGTMVLNSLIKIRGNQNLPVVTANAKLLDGSTFTFVVLEGDLNTSRGEGVVVFEDSIPALRPQLPQDTLQMRTQFKGIDLSANIEVNRNSVFRVIVDPESGDNLEVSGDANLAFSIDQSGKVSLSGTYTLQDGHYQASFQKVLKREFKMKPGSQISWSGDPLEGQIDLTAVYSTQAAATDLLAAELTGMAESERMAYRKLLNYEVNLKVEGPVLKPQLSFSLDMPPEDQLAFGGMVYAKVNVLNTDPNELNKQVFSLLVLNKFLPTGNSQNTSTGDAVSTIARNSVNQMLSEQLNTLSGRYIKGAELNFNLQTTDDYAAGSTQQNTALQVGLKKELFNSRLSVQVGSSIDISGASQQQGNSNGQSISGDVLVEYKLTTDGRYRLKAFRQNQYEGIIDGILYKTGLGISFTRDYNKFSELFRRPAKDSDAQYTIPKTKK